MELTHSKNKTEQNIHQLFTLEFCSTVFLCETREVTLFDDKVPRVGSARGQRPTMFIYRRFFEYLSNQSDFVFQKLNSAYEVYLNLSLLFVTRL